MHIIIIGMDPQPDTNYAETPVKTEEGPSFFKKRFESFRNRWKESPTKKKALIILVPLFIVSGITLLLLRRNGIIIPGGKPGIDKTIQEISEGFNRMTIPGREQPFFTLTSTTKNRFGILPNEVLVLKTKEPFEKDRISENLKSDIPVNVKKINTNTFEITPANNLSTDQLINVNLKLKDKEIGGHKFDRDYSWSFQTQGKFRIVSSIPGDKKTGIPLNAGIEITFSQDDFTDAKGLLSVEPAIGFRTEVHGQTLAIVPLKPLEPETVYTVTLKKGLNLRSRNDPISDDFSFSFQTQAREVSSSQSNIHFGLDKNFMQVSPDDPAVIGVNSYNWKNEYNVKTKIYKFKGSDDFLASRADVDKAEGSWYTYFSGNNKVTVTGLEQISTADLKIQEKEEINYLQLPDKLSEGYYFVQFWYTDKDYAELWLQSSTLSAYASVGRRQTLVWVNDVQNHQPVDTAQIKSPGTNISSVTNDKGTTVFSTPQTFFDSGRHYLEISSSNKSLVIPVTTLKGQTDGNHANSNDYWSYIYNERRLYKPGDTVNFWGVVKKRDGNAVPSTVTVSVNGNYYSDSNQSNDLVSVTLVPEADGTFKGSLELKDVNTGWYWLNLKVYDTSISQSNFQVSEYVKPEMKIEVSTDKKAVFAGEAVKYNGKISFFDGTPVKGIGLNAFGSYSGQDSVNVETDGNGTFEYTYNSKFQGNTDNYPRSEAVTFTPKLSKEGDIEAYGSVMVYGSKLQINTKNSQEEHTAKLSGTVNKVDLTNVNKGIGYDVKGSPVSDKDIKLQVTKSWWESIQTGTYYDFVEKVTRPTYQYKRHDEKTADTTLRSNSEGSFSYEFNMEDGKSYEALLTAVDEDGREVKRREYYYYYKGNNNFYQEDKFATPELNLSSKENEFSVGQEVGLSVNFKGEPYKDDSQNRFLFVKARRGMEEAIVSDTPEYKFNFSEDLIPEVYVGSVIFTGNHYLIAHPYCNWEWGCSYYNYYYDEYYFDALEIRYKKSDSKLEFSITADKDKYKPSEDAEVKVKVTREGTPVYNAKVNLVLVDQALEAIGGVIKPSALSSLYRSVPSEIYYAYYTHKSPLFKPPAAERGGGGDSREIFKDTAFFGEAVSDTDGYAVFKFKLPDNITTWSAYTQGVTSDLKAGEGSGTIVVTKDFFVTSNFPSEVLTKDQVSVTANSFGTGVSPKEKVKYDFSLKAGDKELAKESKEGLTSKELEFKLPGMESGDYKAVLTGKAGNFDDTLIYPVRVIDSRLDLKADKTFKGSFNDLGLGDIREDKPVKLIITDQGKGRYYSDLYDFCFSYSNRVEKSIAKDKAAQILNRRFREDSCDLLKEEISKFQNPDGGIALVSWGGSDLPVTAWAFYVNKDLFDKEKGVKYFELKSQEGNSGSLQKIYTDWGLTLLGKPRLTELKLLAENATSFEEKITSALALASAGDVETAREIYLNILSDYGYTNKPYIRIQRNQDDLKKAKVDDFVNDSARALLLGSIVTPEYDAGLYSYLRDYQNATEDIVIDLARITFINEEMAKLPDEDTNLTLKTGGRQLSYNLNKGGSVSVKLLKGEQKTASVNVTSGKAEIKALYYVLPEKLEQTGRDGRLQITRNYSKANGQGAITPGELVRISINIKLDPDKAPLGAYEITDHLPSGLVYLPNSDFYGFSDADWVMEPRNGVIKFRIYNSPWWQVYGKKDFHYYARATALGNYVAEPAILQAQSDLSVINFTKQENLEIKPQ